MLVAVLTMYSLSTVCYALDIASLWRELNIVLPQRLSSSAKEDSFDFEMREYVVGFETRKRRRS